MKALLLAALLLPSSALAADLPLATEQDRRTPVEPTAPRPYAVAPVSRAELLNGLKLAAVESARLPVVALELALPFGGRTLDPLGKEGLAELTAALLTEGAGGRDADAFTDAVDDLGASVSVTVKENADALVVKIFARKENVDAVLALVADMVRRPALPEASVERLREEMLAGLAAKKGEPAAIAERRLRARVYGEHPYGRSPDEATVGSLTRADALAAAARLSDPRGARLTSAGDLTVDELRALAERHFGDWAAAGPLPAPAAGAPVAGRAAAAPRAAPGLVIDLFDMPGSGQSAIRFGQPFVTRDHPDFYALRVMMEVLGGGTGRLHRNIREDKGWAYGAYAFMQPQRDGGDVSGETDVETPRTADALREVFAEMERIRREPVPAEELEKAKLYAAGGFLRRQQKAQSVAAQTTTAELNGLPADEMARYRDKIMAVTAEQVLAAAARHLTPGSLHVVIAGDAEKVYESLSAIAPVKVYGADGVEKPAPVKKPSNT